MFIVTIYLIKKRILNFKYGLYWVATSIVLIFFMLNEDTAYVIKKISKFGQHSTIFILIMVICILMLLFYLTIVISKMQNHITRLAQKIGLLESRYDNHNK